MIPFLSQDSQKLGLKWRHGDPVSIQFTVKGVDWTGTYKAQIKKVSNMALVGELTVISAVVGEDTLFTLTMSGANSISVPPSTELWWDMQLIGGPTRLDGPVRVSPQVTT